MRIASQAIGSADQRHRQADRPAARGTADSRSAIPRCCERDRLGVGADAEERRRGPATGSRRIRRAGSTRWPAPRNQRDEDRDVDHPVLAEQEGAATSARRSRARGRRPARVSAAQIAPRSARAEEPLRAHDQHRDQDDEERHRRPGRGDLGRQDRLAHSTTSDATTAPPRLPRPPSTMIVSSREIRS